MDQVKIKKKKKPKAKKTKAKPKPTQKQSQKQSIIIINEQKKAPARKRAAPKSSQPAPKRNLVIAPQQDFAAQQTIYPVSRPAPSLPPPPMLGDTSRLLKPKSGDLLTAVPINSPVGHEAKQDNYKMEQEEIRRREQVRKQFIKSKIEDVLDKKITDAQQRKAYEKDIDRLAKQIMEQEKKQEKVVVSAPPSPVIEGRIETSLTPPLMSLAPPRPPPSPLLAPVASPRAIPSPRADEEVPEVAEPKSKDKRTMTPKMIALREKQAAERARKKAIEDDRRAMKELKKTDPEAYERRVAERQLNVDLQNNPKIAATRLEQDFIESLIEDAVAILEEEKELRRLSGLAIDKSTQTESPLAEKKEKQFNPLRPAEEQPVIATRVAEPEQNPLIAISTEELLETGGALPVGEAYVNEDQSRFKMTAEQKSALKKLATSYGIKKEYYAGKDYETARGMLEIEAQKRRDKGNVLYPPIKIKTPDFSGGGGAEEAESDDDTPLGSFAIAPPSFV